MQLLQRKIIKTESLFTQSLCCKAVIIGLVLCVSGCGGSSSDDSEQVDIRVTDDTTAATETTSTTDNSDTTNTSGTIDNSGTVDITNAILTNISADCADYVNTYSADVTDVQEATDFVLDVAISSDDVFCTMLSNNIPNHDFNATGNFATVARATSQEFIVTRSPSVATSTTALSQQQYDAVMLNGVPLDILSAGCYQNGENVPFGCTINDDWLSDPLSTEGAFGADSHNAHTQPTGVYHYHGTPNALFDATDDSAASPVIGFAADGFPIYGTYFTDTDGTVRKATSSYSIIVGSRSPETNGVATNDNPGGDYDGEYIDDYEYIESSGDLDECNGMTINGQYGYYVTESYPWVIACFSGDPDASFRK